MDGVPCPNCGSDHVLTTLVGCMGRDSNRASCADCKWEGKSGDWKEIYQLKQQIASKKGLESLEYRDKRPESEQLRELRVAFGHLVTRVTKMEDKLRHVP